MWKSTSASGTPDNSSLSHFSAMTRPSWFGRAARNRHRHAIEQASRRWRGGRRDDSARTRSKILISTQEKIRKWIVDRNLDVDIEVDGGIKATPETIGACAAAGANCFIAGSGLFAYDDMSQGVKELKAIAEEYQKK